MKKDIHPNYNTNTKAVCACGAQFAVGSTMNEIKTEICSQCHPFFSDGDSKVAHSAGRVERFKNLKAAHAKTKK